jgi:predicted RNA-binding Zn-ribbon protein involved in translation (DUF1610 family)
MSDDVPTRDAACLNCGQAFGAVRPKFCPECGQETTVRTPTLREFAQHFGGSYVAAEGALWRTLVLLLSRPGQLTREYLAGRRRHYVLPLRLYLTISLVALLVLRGVAALQPQVTLSPEAAAEVAKARSGDASVNIGPWHAGLHDGKLVCDDMPRWACERLKRRIDIDPANFGRDAALASDQFLAHWGSAMFVLVPIFAAWMLLAYRNRRMHYAEHLVYALHVHAFWFAAILVTTLLPDAVAGLGALALPVYAVLAARRVYGGRWSTTLLRNAAVAAAYSVTFALVLGVVAVWTFLG